MGELFDAKCPKCGKIGRVAAEDIRAGVQCPYCGVKFCPKITFWARQKARSPLLNVWWLGPVLALWLGWALGGIPTGTLVVIAFFIVLLWIAISLSRLTRK